MKKLFTFCVSLLSVAVMPVVAAEPVEQPVVEWAKLVETETATCQANSVAVQSADDVYWFFTLGSHEETTESYWGGEVLFSGTPYAKTQGNSASQDIALIKTDGNGNVKWVLHSLPGECMSNEGQVAVTKDGGVVLTASIRHTSGFFDSYKIIDGKGVTHDLDWAITDGHRFVRVLVMKVAADGGMEWYSMIDCDHSPAPAAKGTYSEYTPQAIHTYGLCLDDQENIYVSGHHKMDIYVPSADGSVTIPCRNNKAFTGDPQNDLGDFYIIKLDKNGKYLKHLSAVGSATKETMQQLQYADGSLYACGVIVGNGNDETIGGVTVSPGDAYSPVIAKLDTDLNVDYVKCFKGERVSGKQALQNYSLTLAGDDMYFVGQYNLKITDPESGNSVTSVTGNVREGVIIKLDKATGNWVKAANSRDSYPTPTSLTGYFDAFVNPSNTNKVYVFGYVMNQDYGVFIRTYDAETLTSDPDTAWPVITGGGSPTCQVMTYDPYRGEAYITARGNRAFTPLGGETTDAPKKKWDGNSCYVCLATKFKLPQEMMSAVGNVTIDVSDNDAPVEYYNMQGIKIENPGRGLYIRRQGSKTEKVVLR